MSGDDGDSTADNPNSFIKKRSRHNRIGYVFLRYNLFWEGNHSTAYGRASTKALARNVL